MGLSPSAIAEVFALLNGFANSAGHWANLPEFGRLANSKGTNRRIFGLIISTLIFIVYVIKINNNYDIYYKQNFEY